MLTDRPDTTGAGSYPSRASLIGRNSRAGVAREAMDVGIGARGAIRRKRTPGFHIRRSFAPTGAGCLRVRGRSIGLRACACGYSLSPQAGLRRAFESGGLFYDVMPDPRRRFTLVTLAMLCHGVWALSRIIPLASSKLLHSGAGDRYIFWQNATPRCPGPCILATAEKVCRGLLFCPMRRLAST